MKLNRFLIAAGIASLALVSCENELSQDVELGVNVVASEGVSFDGQTITVKSGTPVQFNFSGDPDFLTFFSGEDGKKYEYRERITIDEDEVESSVLDFTITPQYGKPAKILSMYIADDFPGLDKKDFEADSALVEKQAWKELIPQEELPQAVKVQSYKVDMKPYLGKRVAIAICYRGQDKTATQSRFTFNNMQIVNTLTSGQQTSLSATSFGFTPINMLYKHNLADQKGMTANRAYGTVTNNTSGIWNFKDMNAFFIHSSNANTELKYSWIVSNLLVANSCTPDAGTNIKSISLGLNTYSYTYAQPGTYTATFVATNGNYKQTKSVVRAYKVVVTE